MVRMELKIKNLTFAPNHFQKLIKLVMKHQQIKSRHRWPLKVASVCCFFLLGFKGASTMGISRSLCEQITISLFCSAWNVLKTSWRYDCTQQAFLNSVSSVHLPCRLCQKRRRRARPAAPRTPQGWSPPSHYWEPSGVWRHSSLRHRRTGSSNSWRMTCWRLLFRSELWRKKTWSINAVTGEKCRDCSQCQDISYHVSYSVWLAISCGFACCHWMLHTNIVFNMNSLSSLTIQKLQILVVTVSLNLLGIAVSAALRVMCSRLFSVHDTSGCCGQPQTLNAAHFSIHHHGLCHVHCCMNTSAVEILYKSGAY